MNIAAVFFDIVVILLLASTLVYAVQLNRKFLKIYQSCLELQQFLDHFTQALTQAEHSLKTLKMTGEDAFSKMETHIAQAQVLREDLNLLTERGENVAANLERAVQSGKQSAALRTNSNTDEPELIQALRKVR